LPETHSKFLALADRTARTIGMIQWVSE